MSIRAFVLYDSCPLGIVFLGLVSFRARVFRARVRIPGGIQQKFFWGMQPLDRQLPVLMKFLPILKQNRHSSINAKLFMFLLWLVVDNYILLATVFIIKVPILNFAHIFSGVS